MGLTGPPYRAYSLTETIPSLRHDWATMWAYSLPRPLIGYVGLQHKAGPPQPNQQENNHVRITTIYWNIQTSNICISLIINHRILS